MKSICGNADLIWAHTNLSVKHFSKQETIIVLINICSIHFLQRKSYTHMIWSQILDIGLAINRKDFCFFNSFKCFSFHMSIRGQHFSASSQSLTVPLGFVWNDIHPPINTQVVQTQNKRKLDIRYISTGTHLSNLLRLIYTYNGRNLDDLYNCKLMAKYEVFTKGKNAKWYEKKPSSFIRSGIAFAMGFELISSTS